MAGNAHETRSTDREPCERDIEIAERLFRGDPYAEIARDTGLSVSSVRAYQIGQRRPCIREHIERLKREMMARTQTMLVHAQKKALVVLTELLDSEDPKIRAQAAQALRRERVSLTGADGEERPRMTALQVVQLIQQHGHQGGNGNGHRLRMIDVEQGGPNGNGGA